ncbi:MAG: endonuclease domain-containing protein [Pleurocapsa sp. MO_226.B13]|nr:endonuclease domain-containing protein [Pleurocapsa sp. MO_226.B13]
MYLVAYNPLVMSNRDRNFNNFHLPYNPDLVAKARELRKNMTPAEKKLWYDYLRNFKFRVLRQRPIASFIVDFYCAALKLVIEVDGDSHFTEAGRAYDAERTRILEGYGLKVIRFTNDEVLHNFEAVRDRIEGSIP